MAAQIESIDLNQILVQIISMNWFRRLWKFGKRSDPRVEEMMRRSSLQGRSHFLEQQIRAIAYLSGLEGAEEFQDDPERMLAVELPFMWGWQLAFAEDQGEWPTAASERATLHMLWYMMDHQGMDFGRARAEAAELFQMWNRAEPLFEAIQKCGQECYTRPGDPILGEVIKRLICSQGATLQ